MNVTYFRNRRAGPEAKVEDVVASNLTKIFPQNCNDFWTGGSVPLGAGLPDLIFVSYTPQIVALAQVDLCPHEILGYLRAVKSASLETIADRVSMPIRKTEHNLEELCNLQVIVRNARSYSLSKSWHNVLPEVVTIEVKMKDWRVAVQQAARNRLFGHKSFVAVPNKLATRISKEEVFDQLGVGILGVDEDKNVLVTKEAVRSQPRVWSYYYKLATFAATTNREMICLK